MTRAWTHLSVRIAIAVAVISFVAILGSQPTPREQVGPLPGGGFLLNSGWVLDPVGKQVPLDTLPMSTALSPDGNYLLVLNGGYRSAYHHRARCGHRRGEKQRPGAGRLAGPDFHAQGRQVYVGGGSKASVFEFTFANGTLTATRTFPVVSLDKRARPGLHRRCGALARRPSDLRCGPVSRFGRGDQSAIGDADRAH